MSPQEMERASRCAATCPTCLCKAKRARLMRTLLVVATVVLMLVSIPVDGIAGILFATAGTLTSVPAAVLARRAMKAGRR
jgi:hypothetical protein